MIVYRIYDRLTGKNYIGQTSKPLNRRIYSHLHSKKSLVGRAMKESDLQHFDVSVLDVCEDKVTADQSEKFWIEFYDSINNGYNVVAGGSPDKKYMDTLRDIPRGEYKKHRKRPRLEKPSRIIRFDERPDYVPPVRKTLRELELEKRKSL